LRSDGSQSPGARLALPPAAAQNGSICPHEPSDISLVAGASLRVCLHSAPEHLHIVLQGSTYLNSKLANMLFAKSLHLHLAAQGRSNVVVMSVSPSIVSTGIWAQTPAILRWAVPLICDRDIARGAATAVFCCFAPECGDVGGDVTWTTARLCQPVSSRVVGACRSRCS
jgi:NAD(P)-dependent dehydrogenase (short-subunit alcohol dehydrogenase family)